MSRVKRGRGRQMRLRYAAQCADCKAELGVGELVRGYHYENEETGRGWWRFYGLSCHEVDAGIHGRERVEPTVDASGMVAQAGSIADSNNRAEGLRVAVEAVQPEWIAPRVIQTTGAQLADVLDVALEAATVEREPAPVEFLSPVDEVAPEPAPGPSPGLSGWGL